MLYEALGLPQFPGFPGSRVPEFPTSQFLIPISPPLACRSPVSLWEVLASAYLILSISCAFSGKQWIHLTRPRIRAGDPPPIPSTTSAKPRDIADPYPKRAGRGGPVLGAPRGPRGGRGQQGEGEGEGQGQGRSTQLNDSPTSRQITSSSPIPSPSPTSNLVSLPPNSSASASTFQSKPSNFGSYPDGFRPKPTPFSPVSSRSQPVSETKTSPNSQAGSVQQAQAILYHPSVSTFCRTLKRFFNNERLADVTIRCGDHEFKVHAVLLSEGGDGKVIKLDEVEVEVVKAMIYFIYHFNYTSPDGVSELLFDAKVYRIADKYLIPKLKDYSKTKFQLAIGSLWDSANFSGDLRAVISEVYCCTPESDRGLRDIVSEACHHNLGPLSNMIHLSINTSWRYAMIPEGKFTSSVLEPHASLASLSELNLMVNVTRPRPSAHACQPSGKTYRYKGIDYWPARITRLAKVLNRKQPKRVNNMGSLFDSKTDRPTFPVIKDLGKDLDKDSYYFSRQIDQR
ncbi:hypothetical protein CIB48_g2928 [Xylaria polymorpha]|nr:hypothetical protein CIB48_g2928 [Xylaria polymorpha]